MLRLYYLQVLSCKGFCFLNLFCEAVGTAATLAYCASLG
jgi:hypothetical protein